LRWLITHPERLLSQPPLDNRSDIPELGGPSSRPFSIPCHFARQPRQHVAVACCAMNTGCPLKGVCFPSFAGFAVPSLFDTRSAAWPRTASRPLLSTYRNSSAPSRKRRRNGDPESSCKIWSMSFVVGLRQSKVTTDACFRRSLVSATARWLGGFRRLTRPRRISRRTSLASTGRMHRLDQQRPV
jgi:hypothetical protein